MGNGCSCTDGVVEPDMADNVSIGMASKIKQNIIKQFKVLKFRL